MAKTLPSSNHLLYLDGLRSLAAIFVVAHHAVIQFYFFDVKNLTGLKKILISRFFQGHFAVDLFIVLSGFCLMMPVVKSNYKLKGGAYFFYKKRAIRIIPTYYIAIIFSLFLITFFIGNKTGTHWDASIPVTTTAFLADLFFIQDFFYSTVSKINHVFWSIAVESRIYILFPLLIFIYKKMNAIWSVGLSIIISVLFYYTLKYINSINNFIPIEIAGLSPYLILFTLGMVSADICFANELKYKFLIKFPWNKSLFVLSILIVILPALIHHNIIIWQGGDVIVGLWSMNLLIVCYKETIKPTKAVWIKNFLSWQPLVFVGTFAYSLYLTHAPLLQIITQYLILPMQLSLFNSTILILVIGIPVCIGFGYIFFLLFEKPFLTLGKKVKYKEIEAITAVNPAI
ncbi:MAG: acyltransferase [Sphingobacteriaceae bacterium]|nr:MAG: acyltransferase [Sphingobacteriaceae bacterium]